MGLVPFKLPFLGGIMFFLNELKGLQKEKNMKKIMIFVDMDGVIADYRFGEGINIKTNKPGTYLNKRPIITTINNLRKISKYDNIDLSIISSCLFKEQVIEKNKWLNKYADFFKLENRIYTMSDSFESRKQLKVDKIKEFMEQNPDVLTVLIDDTHDILFSCQKQLGKNFIPMHVITLID